MDFWLLLFWGFWVLCVNFFYICNFIRMTDYCQKLWEQSSIEILSQRMTFLRECMNIPDTRTYHKKLLIHSYDIVPPILKSVFSVKQTRWDFVWLWQYIAAVPTNHSCSLLEHLLSWSTNLVLSLWHASCLPAQFQLKWIQHNVLLTERLSSYCQIIGKQLHAEIHFGIAKN